MLEKDYIFSRKKQGDNSELYYLKILSTAEEYYKRVMKTLLVMQR